MTRNSQPIAECRWSVPAFCPGLIRMMTRRSNATGYASELAMAPW
jgi:hypothetical protein